MRTFKLIDSKNQSIQAYGLIKGSNNVILRKITLNEQREYIVEKISYFSLQDCILDNSNNGRFYIKTDTGITFSDKGVK